LSKQSQKFIWLYQHNGTFNWYVLHVRPPSWTRLFLLMWFPKRLKIRTLQASWPVFH